MKSLIQKASPILVVIVTLMLGLVSTGVVVWTSLHQPWMGLYLTDGPGQGVLVQRVATDGPAAGLIAPGDRIIELRHADAPDPWALSLTPQDRIEEPDTLPDARTFAGFMERQGRIAAILAQGSVALRIVKASTDTSVTETHLVQPAPRRPLTSLPAVFWIQVGVGLTGIVLAGWVLALRRHDTAVQYFLLAGAGLLLAAQAAAVYSTRELALPSDVFILLSRLNFAGTMTFGIGMINLFLMYPSPLGSGWAQRAVAALFGCWILAIYLEWPAALQSRQTAIALAMVILLMVILAQVFVNRKNPTARAMLGWFGLAVLIGAGGFGLTVTLPILMGGAPILSQGHAFLFFLVIFAGLAMGIARYRLFDLSEWSFRILFHVGGVVLLLALDALLIFAMSLDRAPALGLSLAIVGLMYLPMRDTIGRWVRRDREFGREELFTLVTEVTLANGAQDRTLALNTLLQRLFNPLSIEECKVAGDAVRLVDVGEALEMPMPHGMAGRRLNWAGQGRRLFTRQDQRMASLVIRMLDRTIARQRERDEAVEMERARINRDMHDNLGVQLLGALHSPDRERKDTLIRQTLVDLRQIISRPTAEGAVLAGLLADLRGELGEHLDAAGIKLLWQDHGLTNAEAPVISLDPLVAQTLRGLLRESTSNILRHSGATQARIEIFTETPPGTGEAHRMSLSLLIADDGRNPAEAWRSTGSGLSNMRHRIDACGGTIQLIRGPEGTCVQAVLPVSCEGLSAPQIGRAAG